MTTAGDARAPNEGRGIGEKFHIHEDPQNVSQEVIWNKNSTGESELSTQEGGDFASISVTIGKPELEQILKQMTFTRSETQDLIALLHSRTIDESPNTLSRPEALTTSVSMKKRKHGDESDNMHASVVISRVLQKENASPAELAKAYKGIGESPRQYLKLNNNNNAKTSVTSPQLPTTMENLPDELLSNIFMRLLAKQLAQMRSVSKSWNGHLSQSSFIKSHPNRSMHDKDQILLVFYYHEESYSDFKPFAAFLCRSPHLELSNFIKLPVNPRPESTTGISIIGSVNGLICSSYGDSVIHIWNPSLSTVLTLPPYCMPPGDDSIKIYFRFVFDPKTEDYKVVKLTRLTRRSLSLLRWWLDVEIYSMKKGTWDLINGRFPSHITDIIDGDYVCADGHYGHLHWLCWVGEKMDSKTIVAFNLGTQTFREMPLPDSILYNRSNDLGFLSESFV